MTTNMKSFTISITTELNLELNETKKKNYYNNTQNEMIRDLIMRGLQDLKIKEKVKVGKGV